MTDFAHNITSWRMWLRGLFGGAIGSAANAVTLCISDPQNYNIFEGFTKLWHFSLASAVVSAALYLKSHPLPDDPTPTNNEKVN